MNVINHLMTKSSLSLYRLILIAVVSVAFVFSAAIIVMVRTEQKIVEDRTGKKIEELELKIARAKFEIVRLKLTTGTGDDQVTIEILPNGVITKTTKDGTTSTILGFSRIAELFGSLTKEQISSFQSSYLSHPCEKYTLSIQTSDGEIVVIDLCLDDESVPQELIELIEAIEEAADTITPTPSPTLTPSPTPIGATPTPTPTPTPNPSGGGFPSPTPLPTPAPDPSSPPDYLSAPPFSCDDFIFIRDTIINDIICLANQPEP